MALLTWARSVLRRYRLRKRFPLSIIHSDVTVDFASTLGNFSVLFSNVSLMNTSLGAYSYIQSNSAIYNAEIGPFCSVAKGVTLGLAAHPTIMVSTSPVFFDDEQPLPRFFIKGQYFTQSLPRTIVGADVWIGQGVMIKAGVRIGTGAVIGAGSIVTRDIPPYAIAVGNPCRVIKYRFSENICQRLLESEWWEFKEEALSRLAPLFHDPETLLSALK